MVSTIIPTYGRLDLLMGRAVPSVLAQGPGVELIVVGDGTDAETVAAMTALAAADQRVRFWNLPRPRYPRNALRRWRVAGLEAINFGLDQATHEWVSVLADDDEYHPSHHRSLLNLSRGADVVYGLSLILPTGQISGDRWPPEPLNVPQGSYIMRRSVAPRIAPEACTDGAWDGYWWRETIASGARFRHVTTIVHRLHLNPASAAFGGAAW